MASSASVSTVAPALSVAPGPQQHMGHTVDDRRSVPVVRLPELGQRS